MAQISTADFKNGITLDLPEGLFQLVEFQHVKPGKGGAFVRTTLKNVRNGAVLDRTFRAGERMERAFVEKKEMQYLYNDGTDYVFMDNASYDQLNVPPTSLGTAVDYLRETDTAVLQMYGDEIVGVDLPAAVELVVTETEPGALPDCGALWLAVVADTPETRFLIVVHGLHLASVFLQRM